MCNQYPSPNQKRFTTCYHLYFEDNRSNISRKPWFDEGSNSEKNQLAVPQTALQNLPTSSLFVGRKNQGSSITEVVSWRTVWRNTFRCYGRGGRNVQTFGGVFKRCRLLRRSGYFWNAIRLFVFPSEQMSNSGSGSCQI